jgi:hypothetical protein
MDRHLTPISEDDQHGSLDTTSYDDLPTVTPVVRTFTFTDTIQRQNAENEALKKKILKLQATLNNAREELNETTEALVASANVNRQQDPAVSHSMPRSIPSAPWTRAQSTSPSRCCLSVSGGPERPTGQQNTRDSSGIKN